MQELFNLFEEIGLPYFRQGSLTDADYAQSFFTFWNVDTTSIRHRDNDEKSFSEYIQVGFYTNDAQLIYSQMDDFINRAKEKGFIVSGKPRDANADKPDYFGRICYLRTLHNI